MTLSAVAFAPHPPLLLRANAGLVDVGAPLRCDCVRALVAAADRGADRVVLLTGRDEPTDERPRSTAAPLGVRVGRELLSLAGIGAPIEVVTVPRTADGPAVEAAAAGVSERCGGTDRVLLLALGDGSARRDTVSPGLPDERALAYDAALLAALARADAAALARLDAGGRDEELLIAGRAALQVAGRVVADASPDLAPTPCGAALVDGFGVAYAVGWWSCVPGSDAVAQPGRPGADVEAVGGASREGSRLRWWAGRMDAMTYIATAKRWDHGWELPVEDVGVTQCTTLDRADRQVRDYLATMLDIDRLDDDITIRAGAVSDRPSRA